MAISLKPDWATKFNYIWHSNPSSRPTSRVYFDKAWVRKRRESAWRTIKTSQDSLDVQQAREIIDTYKDDNANMACGRTVQDFTDAVLLDDQSPADALSAAKAKLLKYKPRTWDDGTDTEKHIHYLDQFDIVSGNALEGLREALSGVNDITGETEVFSQLNGLQLPYFTKPDYVQRVELKTQWDRRNRAAKSGWSANSLPKEPTHSHLMQVAGVYSGTHLLPTLVYANRLGFRVFTPDNCEKLSEEFMRYKIKEIVNACRVRERHLRAAYANGGEPHHLCQMTEPDFSHFTWDVTPEAKQIARDLWERTD